MPSLLALDLFLLEKWNADSAESPTEQSARIFQEYVRLGCAGRHRYHQDLERGTHEPVTATQWDQILIPARTARERKIARSLMFDTYIWLRTCYPPIPASDIAHTNLIERVDVEISLNAELGQVDDADCILDDVTHYNYGPNWQQIFTRLPEILDNGNHSPDQRYQRIADAIRNTALLSDELDFKEKFSAIQHVSVTGILWVADQEALETERILVAWVDDCGRVVRKGRMSASDVEQLSGMLFEHADDESQWWEEADVGADYLQGGACGPPYAHVGSAEEGEQ